MASSRRPARQPPFESIYRHGFARVAVATPRVEVASPAINVAGTLELAGRAADRARRPRGFSRTRPVRVFERGPVPAGRAARRFPRCAADAGRGEPRAAAGAGRGPAAPRRRPSLQLRRAGAPRPDPRCRAEELPAELPRVLREAAFRAGRAGDLEFAATAGPGRAVRRRAAVRGPRPARLRAAPRESARTPGCRCRRARSPRSPAPRCSRTSRRATSPWARRTTAACSAPRSPRNASRPASTRPPGRANRRRTWPGTAMH